jgi:hypothetical protein
LAVIESRMAEAYWAGSSSQTKCPASAGFGELPLSAYRILTPSMVRKRTCGMVAVDMYSPPKSLAVLG